MKRLLWAIVAIAIVVGLVAVLPTRTADFEYLHLQISANSNSPLDQAAKYQIKDEITNYLTPMLQSAQSKADAIKIVNDMSFNLTAICMRVLKEYNLSYSANLSVKDCHFEKTENYKAGVYSTLVINLGAGSGKDESAVIYPPLNVNSNKQVKFKSKLAEFISGIFN